MIDAEKSKGANAKAEIIDGVSRPKGVPGPPPATFTVPPKKKKTT
jgi:hypothetical protein